MEYKIGTTVLDGWEITKELGAGASGRVFEIQKKSAGFDLMVRSALKVITIPPSLYDFRYVLNEGMDDKSATSYYRGIVEDVVREIAIMTTLKSHPNIVSCEDYFINEYPDEIRWDILIRMELLTPLTEYNKMHPMDEETVVRMGREICDALAFCQRQAIIHRDVKPGNILVSDTGQFKLGDFGVAKQIKKAGNMSVKGTEDYMAPETFVGQHYGPTVDIYSLGLVMYQYLNRLRLPFFPPAPQPIKHEDRANASIKRRSGEPLPPPVDASDEVFAVIRRACAFSPDGRYKSAAEMKAALDACARHGSMKGTPSAAPTDDEERLNPPTLGKWPKREVKQSGKGENTQPLDEGPVQVFWSGPYRTTATERDVRMMRAWETVLRNVDSDLGTPAGIDYRAMSLEQIEEAWKKLGCRFLHESSGAPGRSQARKLKAVFDRQFILSVEDTAVEGRILTLKSVGTAEDPGARCFAAIPRQTAGVFIHNTELEAGGLGITAEMLLWLYAQDNDGTSWEHDGIVWKMDRDPDFINITCGSLRGADGSARPEQRSISAQLNLSREHGGVWDTVMIRRAWASRTVVHPNVPPDITDLLFGVFKNGVNGAQTEQKKPPASGASAGPSPNADERDFHRFVSGGGAGEATPPKPKEPKRVTARDFWSSRLSGLATGRMPNATLQLDTNNGLNDLAQGMGEVIVQCGHAFGGLTAGEIQDLSHIDPTKIVGVLGKFTGMTGKGPQRVRLREAKNVLLLTDQAIYLNLVSGPYGMEHRDGLFAARYRDIKAVKAVTIEGWNNYALKVLMKNGTIRLCSSYDAKDLVPLNKLALFLSEFLRAYP